MNLYRMNGEEFTYQVINPEFKQSLSEQEEKRLEIQEQVDKFLSEGGIVQIIPFGRSSMIHKPISKQFRI